MFSNRHSRDTFDIIFNRLVNETCGYSIHVKLTFIECNYEHRLAWAQNDAMMRAYLENCDYFYRINDGISMQTANWTEQMIDQLQRFDPPNIGVVHPTHTEDNWNNLTNDFVHRTHIQIFGFYYPRIFWNNNGNMWMGEVYGMNRTTRMSTVQLNHTREGGKHYDEINKEGGTPTRELLNRELRRDVDMLHT